MTLQCGVVLENSEDGWIMARVPSLPGVVTQGRTRERYLRIRVRPSNSLSKIYGREER